MSIHLRIGIDFSSNLITYLHLDFREGERERERKREKEREREKNIPHKSIGN